MGDRVQLLDCFTPPVDVLGIAEESPPKGMAHDCDFNADAYSRGRDWFVCWIAMPGADVSRWPDVSNPFRSDLKGGF